VFVDSLSYNAHSTAVELLWCSVPVVSVAGRAMAGRVAASVLLALNAQSLLARNAHELEVRYACVQVRASLCACACVHMRMWHVRMCVRACAHVRACMCACACVPLKPLQQSIAPLPLCRCQ
jgi:hypothetical protein